MFLLQLNVNRVDGDGLSTRVYTFERNRLIRYGGGGGGGNVEKTKLCFRENKWAPRAERIP